MKSANAHKAIEDSSNIVPAPASPGAPAVILSAALTPGVPGASAANQPAVPRASAAKLPGAPAANLSAVPATTSHDLPAVPAAAEPYVPAPATNVPNVPVSAVSDGTAFDGPSAVISNTAVNHVAGNGTTEFSSCESVAQSAFSVLSRTVGSDTATELGTATPIGDINKLEEQLKILRLRRELMELQGQVQQIETYPGVRLGKYIHFDELDAAVPKFSGDNHYDINRWYLQFEDYADANNYNERHRCLALRRCMSGTAKEFLLNQGLVDYSTLKSLLCAMFRRNCSRQEVYRQLRSRKLKSSESCVSYIVAMQSIAAQSEIPEQELIDIVIDGIPDNSNNISILYGANTVSELVRRMERYEQRRQNIALRKPSATVVSRTEAKSTVTEDLSTVRCFNCSRFGHYQSSCPKPQRPVGSCFICHQLGHMHRNCPKKKSQPTHVAAISAEDYNYLETRQEFD
ncbi:uncharacterized protein LOC118734759 [Rhagoletis pomonella]|uniref:uncharacterized protein LOC118734759 n=1 Tax=Rhagoletis pomonella TaxID=28610 RepID=UPI00178459E1|nr:uncharacterized protein LOC118734759 [Rhagoletis pomonella]